MVKASLIWLNYNSSRFIDVALRSIESVLNLDFEGYEVVVVDNASMDGSFEVIRKFIEEKKPSNVRVKFVRSDVNRGYAGGMNLGWEAKDRDARYVAFLNNDLIVEPDSLRGIIEHMEGNEKIAAASGLIYFGDGRTIYSAGGFGSENWLFGDICMYATEDECPSLDKPHYVTYSDGAYMVVRTDAIERAGPQGKPFIDETFLYLDDVLLGLILWNNGCRVTYVPVKAGLHYANMTTKPVLNYYGIRGNTAAIDVVSTRYSAYKRLYYLRRSMGYRALCRLGRREYCQAYKGYLDGWKLAEILKTKYKINLDLYKAPFVRISKIRFILDYIFLKNSLPKIITFEDLSILN